MRARTFLSSFALAIVIVPLVAGAEWKEPTSGPPNGGPDAPITTGEETQGRTGRLLIVTGADQVAQMPSLYVDDSIHIGTVGLENNGPLRDARYKLDVEGPANVDELCIKGICETEWPTANLMWRAVTKDADNNGGIYYGTKVVSGSKVVDDRVGIGSFDPQAKLEIFGYTAHYPVVSIAGTDDASEFPGGGSEIPLYMPAGGAPPHTGLHINNRGGPPLFVEADGEDALIVDASGNVGIGNSAPKNKLHVTGAIGATGWIGAGCEINCDDDRSYSILRENGLLQFKTAEVAETPVPTRGTGQMFYDSTSGKIKVSQDGSAFADLLGASSQWSNVTGGINYAGGKVGIGVASPVNKLDVAGKIEVSGTGADVCISGGKCLSTTGTGSGTVTGVTATAPLSATSGSAPVISISACGGGQILKYNGSAWACSGDLTGGSGTVTGVTATAPLISSGGTAPSISIGTSGCSSGQVLKYNGSAWACSAAVSSGDTINNTTINNSSLTNITNITATSETVTNLTATNLTTNNLTTANESVSNTFNISNSSFAGATLDTCATGQILKATRDSAGKITWACAADATGGSGTVTATGGVANYISKFSGATALAPSLLYDNGTNVGIGAGTAPTAKLDVRGTASLGTKGFSDVYSTKVTISGGNLHVFGNEAGLYRSGGFTYGPLPGMEPRLRVGNVWNYPGIYAEILDYYGYKYSTDLVLGASSRYVRVGPANSNQSLLVSGSVAVGVTDSNAVPSASVKLQVAGGDAQFDGNLHVSGYLTGASLFGSTVATNVLAINDGSSLALPQGGAKGTNGAPGTQYPERLFESTGWNFTLGNTNSNFKILKADGTSPLATIDATGNLVVTGKTTTKGGFVMDVIKSGDARYATWCSSDPAVAPSPAPDAGQMWLCN